MKKILVLSLVAVSAASFAVEDFGAGFSVPDFAGTPGVASSSIALSQGAVSIDYVRLNGATHTWVGDWDADVNGVFMFASVGATTATGVGDSSDLGGDYTFAAAGGNFWTEAAAGTGTYVMASGTYMSSDALSGGVSNGFIGGSYAAGHVFTLTISDNAGGDVGGIISWTIGYTAVPEPATMAALGLGVAALIRRRRSK